MCAGYLPNGTRPTPPPASTSERRAHRARAIAPIRALVRSVGGDDSRVLIFAAMTRETQRRYARAAVAFAAWLLDQPPTVRSLPMDTALCHFVHSCFARGLPRSVAANAVYGVQTAMGGVRGTLVDSTRALKGWERLEPSVQRPPLLWELAVAVAVRLARARHLSAAIAVLLAFDCYLRIGELLAVRVCDVALPRDSRSGVVDQCIIALPRTKTGTNQSVVVRHPHITSLLSVLVRVRRRVDGDGALVFALSQARFRSLFTRACAALGLSAPYTPHSLRHGGATHDYVRGVPIADIMARGRWRGQQSAARYIQSGRAQLLATRVPAEVMRRAGALAMDVHRAVVRAVSKAWRSIQTDVACVLSSHRTLRGTLWVWDSLSYPLCACTHASLACAFSE